MRRSETETTRPGSRIAAMVVGALMLAPALIGAAAAPAEAVGLIDIPVDASSGLGETTPDGTVRPLPRAVQPDDSELAVIPDEVLKREIAKALKTSPSGLTKGDLRKLRSLTAKNVGITDLSGLEDASNLDLLYIDGNEISSLEPIRGLTQMRQITVSRNPISDISPLQNMPELNWLEVNWTEIDTLEPLRGNTSLLWLQLAYTKVTSLDPIRESVGLYDLNFQNTEISDLEPLTPLTRIATIGAQSAQISSLEPLRGKENLRLLNVNRNHVTDLSMLETWPNISTVGFNAQTVTGGEALVPSGASEYTRSDVVSLFKMPFGERQRVVDLATPTADGEGATWSGIAEDSQKLEVYLSQAVVPNGPAFSATVDYSVARADFTNQTPGDGSLEALYNFVFSTTPGFIEDTNGAGYSLLVGEVPGLSLGEKGQLSGTPSEQGDFSFTVRATDRHGNTLDREYTIHVGAKTVKPEPPVKPGPPTTGGVTPPLVNTGADSPWAFGVVALTLSVLGAAIVLVTQHLRRRATQN
ncbi:leucine-rich repeat domain-containing protein [Leucobacter sp. UT-8R-CII-1-4]|uniref:leucine-rich repeat domain-containing protein n=1 Tax=Leucobacter sp. UT-8R-CII-1-4 TaxID=3040075 RepID=UPI0024A86416|nr:leucine-rich repeat domain-containing protein [Leucobacter sp. UT-8R-CII-1-4]MDI6024575.1 leucine-rich repeat domain-containing protein [Leucobacter sp. UT-8R-CII-1-4]